MLIFGLTTKMASTILKVVIIGYSPIMKLTFILIFLGIGFGD